MFHVIRFLFGVMLIGLIVTLAACAANPTAPTPAPTATSSLPSIVPLSVSTSPTPTPVPAQARPITLTLWLPASFAENPARDILAQQIDDFATTTDGAPVEVLLKNDRGPGGLLDLLKSASPVAPRVLPDALMLDTADLEAAARLGLLQPIGSLLPTDVISDQFPFARDLGTINGTLYGLIDAADLEHAIFNDKLMPVVPARWSQVLTSTKPVVYVFAVQDTSGGVSDAVLADYFALGGSVNDSAGQPILEQGVLTQLLDLYRLAQRKNVLPENILDLNDSNEAWNTFRASGAALTRIRASIYISVHHTLPSIQFAALPAADGSAAPIAHGWALAIVTRDARRQASAARLIQWLTSPPNNGAWTQAAALLPARASSFTQWDQSDPYTGFVHDQLQQARAAPPMSIMNVIGPALRKAIDDVLSGRATPDAAALLAVTTVGTGKK